MCILTPWRKSKHHWFGLPGINIQKHNNFSTLYSILVNIPFLLKQSIVKWLNKPKLTKREYNQKACKQFKPNILKINTRRNPNTMAITSHWQITHFWRWWYFKYNLLSVDDSEDSTDSIHIYYVDDNTVL